MNYRLKIIILSSLVAFFSLTFVLGLFLLPRGPFAQRVRNIVEDFDQNEVTRIEIMARTGGTKERIVLQTLSDSDSSADEEREWFYPLGDELIPVRSDRVVTLLSNVALLERYRIVTSNSDLYSELGFNDQQSSRLLLYNRNDEVIVDIEQGAIDQQRGVYARLADDENVYLISDEIVFQLEQRAGYWQQGNLFPAGLVSQNVIAFSLIASGIPLGNDGEEIRADYTLIRTAPTGNEFPAWQVNESPEIAVDQAEIDTLLSSLLILEADSFSALSASEVGINDASDARIEITLDDESRYTIAIIDNPLEAALYYLTIKGPRAATRADGSDYLYNVNEFSIRPLIKALPDLFPPPQEDETEGETASP